LIRGASSIGKWLGISLLVVLLDQLTKRLAEANLTYAEPLAIWPSFNLTLLYNRGAAFSFLSDAGGWQRWFFVSVSLLTSFRSITASSTGRHSMLPIRPLPWAQCC
jgi:signal peptidase II